MSKYNSQERQDEYLETKIFKNFKHGIFVDVGAHDGITINNTLYFEKYNNWTGINIEPISEIYEKLKINRPNCINLNCAVSNTNGIQEFIENKGYTEMISGLKEYYDPRHKNRLDNENNFFKSKSFVVNVNCKRLEDIFEENNVKKVNYLSIDVEGAEFEVIKSINFDKVFIDVIAFENNYMDKSIPIINYLFKKNFILLNMSFDIFMINKFSEFNI